ncbi:MAG: hypothetical protein P9M03_02590, partial [Candidatus Theseobacter exili]|nr:hypothetical protein [Candidatus Theseobacter exili]
ELFKPVLNTGLDTNLAIRQLTKEDATWFYVANPCQWPVKGALSIQCNGPIYSVPDNEKKAQGNTSLAINLEPFGIAAFYAKTTSFKIVKYQTEPLDDDWVERIEGVILKIKEFTGKPNVSVRLSKSAKTSLTKSLNQAEALIAKREYAHAWSVLTHPEVWLYYIYEPSCERKIMKKIAKDSMKSNLKAELPKSCRRIPRSSSKHRILQIKKTDKPVKIDGILNEKDWETTLFSCDFWSWDDNKMAAFETGVKMLFDDKNLYLAFICADKDTNRILALAKGEMDIFSSEDDVMAMLLYPEDKGCYYQFALNTRGVKFDQKNIIRGKRLYSQYQPEWKCAVKVHPEYWVAEVRIPLKEIGLEKAPNWMKGNFLRVFRGKLVGNSFWSRTTNAHSLGNFGVLKFNK